MLRIAMLARLFRMRIPALIIMRRPLSSAADHVHKAGDEAFAPSSKTKKFEYICKKCTFKGESSSFFCDGCHYLKSPSTLKAFSYFELFGMYRTKLTSN